MIHILLIITKALLQSRTTDVCYIHLPHIYMNIHRKWESLANNMLDEIAMEAALLVFNWFIMNRDFFVLMMTHWRANVINDFFLFGFVTSNVFFRLAECY